MSYFSKRNCFRIYIFFILLLVALPINSAKQLNNITILHFRGDYFFHALLFFPWSFFQGSFIMKWFWWLLAGFLFAAGSEGLQYLLPYRAWNINDLVANCLGVLLGFIGFVIAGIISQRKDLQSR